VAVSVGIGVSVGLVVTVEDTAGFWVAVDAGELQADEIRMTMMTNVTNPILGFISSPFSRRFLTVLPAVELLEEQ
jgi:hypothetical protein